MAKLFQPTNIIDAPAKRSTRYGSKYFVSFLIVLVSLIIFVFINREKEREIKNKNMENLIELLNMDNGSVLTQKVKYTTFEKTDPEDTSDVFFEVVNPGESDYKKGDLLKYNHRFFKEQGIEGKKYCIIEKGQVDFHLKKEHVKESLLKRQ